MFWASTLDYNLGAMLLLFWFDIIYVLAPVLAAMWTSPDGYILHRQWFNSGACEGWPEVEEFAATGLCIEKQDVTAVEVSSSVTTVTANAGNDYIDIITTSFRNLDCTGNVTSQVPKTQTLDRCIVGQSAMSSSLFIYQAGLTVPSYSIYGYAQRFFASAAACTHGGPLAAETIFNRKACRSVLDANGSPSGRYESIVCDSQSFTTALYSDAACTLLAPLPAVTTVALSSDCHREYLKADACLLQVPTLAPTTATPTLLPSPAPTRQPTRAPSPLPTPYPTVPLTQRYVYFMGANNSKADSFSASVTLRGLSPATGSNSTIAFKPGVGVGRVGTRWFLTVDLLGTGFASPLQQQQLSSGVSVTAVVNSAGDSETLLFSGCKPHPLCDASEETGYTTCLANFDATSLVAPSTGSLRISAFTVGPVAEAMCKRDGNSLFLRVTVSGTFPIPTAAPSALPPSEQQDDVLSSAGGSAADARDVFKEFKTHMFIAFICFAPLATLTLLLLRRRHDVIQLLRVTCMSRLGKGDAEIAALPSIYHLGNGALAIQVLLFGGAFILESFLGAFVVMVGSQVGQEHFAAIGSLLLSARALLLLPNLLILVAVSGPQDLSKHYGAFLDKEDLRRGARVFAIVRVLVVFDATFVRLLPWRRSLWTDSSGGYPGFGLMRFCVYSKMTQCCAVMLLEISFLSLCKSDGVNSTSAFSAVATSFTLATLLHCLSAIVYLLEYSKARKRRAALKLLEAEQPAIEHGDVHRGGRGLAEVEVGGVHVNPMQMQLKSSGSNDSVFKALLATSPRLNPGCGDVAGTELELGHVAENALGTGLFPAPEAADPEGAAAILFQPETILVTGTASSSTPTPTPTPLSSPTDRAVSPELEREEGQDKGQATGQEIQLVLLELETVVEPSASLSYSSLLPLAESGSAEAEAEVGPATSTEAQ